MLGNNVENGHAHRFRDTFAVKLLLKSTPNERVSVLLGHRTTRITEKHYAPWVKARQEQLEADLQRTWETDPLLLNAGTQQVRGKTERPKLIDSYSSWIGRGGGDRKQQLREFQGLTRNAEEH